MRKGQELCSVNPKAQCRQACHMQGGEQLQLNGLFMNMGSGKFFLIGDVVTRPGPGPERYFFFSDFP